ncbi:cytochrome P450 [Suillus discolor]|uniref:Cytochrome P450 n=1 Tax=Suillus discolor TaxID=1912936 RepID=A0A9P7EYX2_9AGAM|nr:cytochrome P450 [Suillus discolor]KAG2098923.1 cytochrome P450 [Suillus discolor]
MGLLQSNPCARDIWLAFKDLCLVSPLSGSTTRIAVVILALFYPLQVYRRQQRTTHIRGPQSPGWVFGFAKIMLDSTATTELYERWAKEYGPVYKVPGIFGQSRVVLWDPKAISHFFARDTWLYNQTPFNKIVVQTVMGRGVLWADGESHQRQRKALNPAFTAAVIRNLTSVFHDAAHKTAIAWDNEIELNQGTHCATIDVQQWMNHISLDSAGIAVLSHDFGALDGNDSDVGHILNAFGSSTNVPSNLIILAQNFPFILKLPLPAIRFSLKLRLIVGKICQEMLLRTRKENETGGAEQAEGYGESAGLTPQEVLDEVHESLNSFERWDADLCLRQARVLLLAGFETTAVSMTWALVELAQNPDIQRKLRDECLEFGPTPSYDDLTNKLPYLDAVVNEVLRLHAPLKEIPRLAMQDDVIPLSEPLRTAAGNFMESVCIPKGTVIVIPLAALNCSVSMWGPDAKAFKPSRWFEGDEGMLDARETLHGYRHLMTFGDGAQTCLGKLFALAEFKAVLFVLVRKFVFEMDDPGVQIVDSLGSLPRPGAVGSAEAGSVPLRARAGGTGTDCKGTQGQTSIAGGYGSV